MAITSITAFLTGGNITITNMDETMSEEYFERDEETYEEYNGTYVQDVEGWSDQMIDDVLDGEPDAYWNID